MKKLLILLSVFLLSVCLFGCAGEKEANEKNEELIETTDGSEEENAETNDEIRDTLIIYFSWSNNTETMANYIHDAIGGDIERIVPVFAYPENYDDTADIAKAQQDNDERPEFEALELDPTSYDTVFIGYPIWWYSLPMIMETFFDTYDFDGITIVPFNTHEGSRDGGTYDMIRNREPNATVLEGLTIRGRDVYDEASRKAVNDWLNSLGLN
ncbi:MAG: NAD(P)H-dependent oxidoreductase [Erysipelotrichaceae bacterium]|nr:NAD(P)H-dependent oxidoreductase [Erysipelotrichaceae bacterium]